MDWKIYYSDGTTFSSEDGTPEQASGYGIQCIVQNDKEPGCRNVGRLVLRSHDWYYYRLDENMWYGGDLYGILDLFLSREPIIALCQGRMLPNHQYRKIESLAMSDTGFLPKSAKKKFETP